MSSCHMIAKGVPVDSNGLVLIEEQFPWPGKAESW